MIGGENMPILIDSALKNHEVISGLEEAVPYIMQENYVIVISSDDMLDELLCQYREHGLFNTVAVNDVFTNIQAEQLLYYTNNVLFAWHSENENRSYQLAQNAEDIIYSLGGNVTGFIDKSLTPTLKRLSAAKGKNPSEAASEKYQRAYEADLGYVGVCFSCYKDINIKELLATNLSRRLRRGDILKIKDPTSENMYQYGKPILYTKSGRFPCITIGKSGGIVTSWIAPEKLVLYDGFKGNLHYLQLKALSEKMMGKIDEQELRSIVGTRLADEFSDLESGKQYAEANQEP